MSRRNQNVTELDVEKGCDAEESIVESAEEVAVEHFNTNNSPASTSRNSTLSSFSLKHLRSIPNESPGSDDSIKKNTATSIWSTVSADNCRICFDNNKEEALITPCLCKGSIGKVHLSCLEHWLGMNNAHSCELCGFRFQTIRRPRYKALPSIYQWLFKETEGEHRRNLCLDTSLILLLSPVIGTAIYSCTAVASFYGKPIDEITASASWTSVSLTLMSTLLAIGYYLWLSLVLKSNGKAWYRWWQAKNVVSILNPNNNRPITVLT